MLAICQNIFLDVTRWYVGGIGELDSIRNQTEVSGEQSS